MSKTKTLNEKEKHKRLYCPSNDNGDSAYRKKQCAYGRVASPCSEGDKTGRPGHLRATLPVSINEMKRFKELFKSCEARVTLMSLNSLLKESAPLCDIRIMKTCCICGESTSKPLRAIWEHLAPIDWSQMSWFRGTFKACGLSAAVTLISPLLNTVLHWKYRKMRLTAPFCALDDLPIAEKPEER